MNTRIQEIALQCGAWNQVYDQKLLKVNEYFNYEKFAELIVRECLDIVNRKEYSYHEADPLWETAQLIKQHFGVENE